MKNIYTLFVTILLSSVLFSQQENTPAVLENPSTLTFSQTVDAIKEAAEEKEWKVLIVHNLQESLRKSGQEVPPVSVIEICKPKYSGQVLKVDDQRSVSVFMPCRISVYEKSDGNVFISRMNSDLFRLPTFGNNETMLKASAEVEEMLTKVIRK